MFPLVRGKKVPTFLKSSKSWLAHFDAIPIVVPMHAHGCLLTASHDGYHRVWNLDKQCLGELVLPNLTEGMKLNSICKDPGSNWRFILERIPVTKHHIDISNTLVKFLKQSRQEKMAEVSDSRRHFTNLPMGFKGFRDTSLDEEGNEAGSQAWLRKSVLKSLVEPPKASVDQPPSRLPTKEEKELLKLSLSLEYATPGDSHSTRNASASNSLVIGEEGTTSFASPPASLSRGNSGTRRKSPPRSLSPPIKRGSASTAKMTSSAVFGGDSSVLLSVLGEVSLWSVPGERDIFGQSANASKTYLPDFVVAPAFSEASLKSLRRDNLIDVEGHKILRRLGASSDRVQVYDRSQPTLLIRNPALSTSVSLPSLESMRKTEISFGPQKDMYKNAEKLLNERDNISKAQVRNAVAKARIELNVRKINSMIHLIQPPSHDEVILPKTKQSADDDSGLDSEELHKMRSDEQKMRIRLMKSASLVPMEATFNRRALDKRSIDRWLSKVNAAIEPFGDHKPRESIQKRKKKEQLSQAAIHVVEKKLQQAIRGEYRARMARTKARSPGLTQSTKDGAESPTAEHSWDEEEDEDDDPFDSTFEKPVLPKTPDKKPVLTTRMLLPYYKLEAVHQFMDIFAKVDENFSGDLDVNEWIRLFSSLNESVPVLEARMIFMKIDKDSDGYLTMRELIPVVFSKATLEQKRAIISYAEMELTKKIECEVIPKVSPADLDFLFEAYDGENIGFVDVALIKERIRTMYLSEQSLFHFMDSISDLADDEMVNNVEFKRLFKAYTSSPRSVPN